MIEFTTIQPGMMKPGTYIEYNTAMALRGLPAPGAHIALIGQKTAGGSDPVLQAAEIFGADDAASRYGAGSVLHRLAMAVYRANPAVAVTAVAVDDDGTATSASGSIAFTGTATAPGSITAYIAGQRYQVGVNTGDAAADIASLLAGKFAADTSLPVTASAATGTVTLTAKNGGTLANDITVEAASTAAGIAAAVTAMTGGTVEPDLTDALAAIYDGTFSHIVAPYTDAVISADVLTHVEAVSGPVEQRASSCWFAVTGAFADAVTFAASLNHERANLIALKDTRSHPAELAATYAAVDAAERDPARPLNRLELPGIDAPAIGNRWSRSEAEALMAAGITPAEVDPAGAVRIVRAITTRTVDAGGTPDAALIDRTTIKTLDYVRDACRIRIELRFPRAKQTERTRAAVRSELLDVLYALESAEIIERVDELKPRLVVETDPNDPNRMLAGIPADVVNGLHILAAVIGMRL